MIKKKYTVEIERTEYPMPIEMLKGNELLDEDGEPTVRYSLYISSIEEILDFRKEMDCPLIITEGDDDCDFFIEVYDGYRE